MSSRGTSRSGPKQWSNFHGTVHEAPIEDHFQLKGTRPPGMSPELAADYFSANAELLKREVLLPATQSASETTAVGSSWSFSAITKARGNIVETKGTTSGELERGEDRSGLEGVFRLNPDQIDAGPATDGNVLFLAGGGVNIGWLNFGLHLHECSLRTSGAANGQTIAGACGTGTHGSVLGVGGIQDHVRGLHLITSPEKSVWIEPETGPRLKRSFINQFADEIITDDTVFSAALVHLGALGIVNAVLLEAVPLFGIWLLQKNELIDHSCFEQIAQGDWAGIAATLGLTEEEMYFYEIIYDPFASYPRRAVHRAFVTANLGQTDNAHEGLVKNANDRLSAITAIPPADMLDNGFAEAALAIPNVPNEVFMKYTDKPSESDPKEVISWGQMNGNWSPYVFEGEIVPLYSCAIAVDLTRVADAVQVMHEAVKELWPKLFIFSIRFVFEASGALPFTRFPKSAVFDIEGARETQVNICKRATAAARAALDEAGIEYSLHWGKLAWDEPGIGLNAEKVRRDFGDPNDPATAAGSWRAARERLLDEDMRKVFETETLRDWGLA